MPEAIAQPTVNPTPPVFEQHPDSLIKKANRGAAPVENPNTPPPEPSPEEAKSLEELKKQLPSLLFDDKPKKAKKEDPAPEPPKAPEAPKATEPAPEPEAPKTKVRKAPDALEIARETGRAIAESLRPAMPAAPAVEPTAPVDPTAHLSAEDKESFELFRVLSDSDPKYKGKDEEFLKFVNKAAAYRKRWEKANPGQTYDPTDTEHEDFYSANQPSFQEADLERARIKLEARREVEGRLAKDKEEYEKRLRDIEERATAPEIARRAAAVADSAVGKFVESLPDEALKAAAKEPEKLEQSDPLAFDILNREAATLRQEVTELHNIIHRRNYFNGNNPVHQHIASFVARQEQAIKALPQEQQVFEGKLFASREEWSQLTPPQQARRWILTEDDVSEMLTRNSSVRASKTLESERKRMETLAAKYGYTRTAPATAPSGKAGTTPAPAAPAARKPSAPSGSDGGALPPTSSPAPKTDEPLEKRLVAALF